MTEKWIPPEKEIRKKWNWWKSDQHGNGALSQQLIMAVLKDVAGVDRFGALENPDDWDLIRDICDGIHAVKTGYVKIANRTATPTPPPATVGSMTQAASEPWQLSQEEAKACCMPMMDRSTHGAAALLGRELADICESVAGAGVRKFTDLKDPDQWEQCKQIMETKLAARKKEFAGAREQVAADAENQTSLAI